MAVTNQGRAPAQEQLNQLVTLFNARHYLQVESSARALVEQYPESGTVWKILGVTLLTQGKESIYALQKAAQLLPDDAASHFNLGNALNAQGHLEEAAASYRRALKIKSDYAEACCNMGIVLRELGRLDDAVANYRRALEIKPDYYRVYSNMGLALHDLGRFEEAATSCRFALEIKPDYTEALNNLGLVLKGLGKFEEAVNNFRRALEIKPVFAEAHFNMGNVQCELGQIDHAVASYLKALEIKPDYTDGYTNLLFTLNFSPIGTTSYCLDYARRFGRSLAEKVSERFSSWRCVARPQRLRVGLVSGDLRDHVVGHFLEGVLSHIDQNRIELIAYPTTPNQDNLTTRIRPCFSEWKSLVGKSDEAAARLIHADGVNVLLDISGHTAHNRLPVFSWKPAPVQASWLGYFATTGVPEMDYLLADEVGVPEDQRQQFTEAVWNLPDTRLCFTPPKVEIPVAALPALSNGSITFGCFQNLSKVGDDVLAAWGNIFAALPNARLRMQSRQLGESAQAELMLSRLERNGIAAARVEIHGWVSREDYLSAHAEIDMILDTFPYPGGTTTCEAMWMGVPTLTLAGDRLLARQGASLMTAAGLPVWVAQSRSEYISKAIAFAGDLPKLSILRAGLRQQVLASPVFDAKRFARNLEEALWGMWINYRNQQEVSL